MTVDPYLIPGTETLKNPGWESLTPAELATFETRMTHARLAQLEAATVTIPGRGDLDHLLAYPLAALSPA